MSSQPKIATSSPTDDLLITSQLRHGYKKASNPALRETATRPLFEDLLNEYLRCTTLSVYGEQQVDNSLQAVDVAVGFYDDNDNEPGPNLIFVLLAELKRHKVSSTGALEAQLQEYADRYLDIGRGGLAKYPTVYGATGYGTKIRFFRFSRESGHLEDMTFSGASHVSERESYWDLKTDGKKIHQVLKEIWEYRKQLDMYSAPLPTRSALRGPEGALRGSETGTSASPADPKGKRKTAHSEDKPPGQASRKKSRESMSSTAERSRYQDVGILSVLADFYSFRVNGELVMKYQNQWTAEGEYLYHDAAQLRGTLHAQNTLNEYTDVGKLSNYKDTFYSFQLDGKLTMKYKDKWRWENGYLYHDEDKLRGHL